MATSLLVRKKGAAMLEKPLKFDQFCRFLSISPYTGSRLLKSGAIPARRVGNSWRVTRSAVLAWLNTTPRPPEQKAA
jgi:excisionase family DNA binding protein